MPRTRKSQMDAHIEERDGNGATAVADPGEQVEMFPELNMEDPKHKALHRAAKDYAKAKADRDAVLTTSKEKVDSAAAKVSALMHGCGMTKFGHKGVKAEIFVPEEKVIVKIEGDEPDED